MIICNERKTNKILIVMSGPRWGAGYKRRGQGLTIDKKTGKVYGVFDNTITWIYVCHVMGLVVGNKVVNL